jgi:hypothetical protein
MPTRAQNPDSTFFVDFGMGGYSLTVLQFTKSWRTPVLSKSKAALKLQPAHISNTQLGSLILVKLDGRTRARIKILPISNQNLD